MVRTVTKTEQFFTNDEEKDTLNAMFEKWMGELPNAREITFKWNRDSITVFVVYSEIREGSWDDNRY